MMLKLNVVSSINYIILKHYCFFKNTKLQGTITRTKTLGFICDVTAIAYNIIRINTQVISVGCGFVTV